MTNFTGTSGDDTLQGGSGADLFDLSQGGEDTAVGKAGDDVFMMGAALDAGDHIEGDGGHDAVVLDGDYSAGLVIGAATLVGIEEIDLAAGHSYVLSGLTDANAEDGLTVDGRHLKGADAATIDASAYDDLITLLGGDGADELIFGAGRSVVQGGDGDDMLIAAGAFSKHDRIDGGLGYDNLVVQGGKLTLDAHDAAGIDEVRVEHDANIKLHDDFVAAGGGVSIVVEGGQATINAKHETDASLHMTGGAEADKLIGGALDDFLIGGGGGDTLVGGAGGDNLLVEVSGSSGDVLQGGDGDDFVTDYGGNGLLSGGDSDDLLATGGAGDTLFGGAGRDTLEGGSAHSDVYLYTAVTDSTPDRPDVIDNLHSDDVIDLSRIDADTTTAGDQAFHIVAALDGHAGELTLHYDAGTSVTTISADVDGDGVADMVIDVAEPGDQSSFNNFVL